MLSITLQPSRLLLGVLCLMHGLCGLAAFLVSLPLAAKVGIAGLLMVSLLQGISRHVWHNHRAAICGLRLQGECELSLLRKDGAWLPATLLPSSFVSPYLTVLNTVLEATGKVRHIVILPDALDAEQFRQLRVWLRWKCPATEGALDRQSFSINR